jgi:hypothetical protein
MSMTTASVEISYGFFCEQLRAEEGGKTSALGILSDVIYLQGTAPFLLPSLALHVHVKNPMRTAFDVVFRLDLPGGVTTPEFRFPVEVNNTSVGHNLNLNFGNIVLTQLGMISARVRLETAPPIEREFQLEIRPLPPGSVA